MSLPIPDEVYEVDDVDIMPPIKPFCDNDPFDGTKQNIPSHFHGILNKFLHDNIQTKITGHTMIISQPGYNLQLTSRYFEVNEKSWMLEALKPRRDGSAYKFLFLAHHIILNFATNDPYLSKWDDIARKLKTNVFAPLSMSDVGLEIVGPSPRRCHRIYPPTIEGLELRYLFASESPNDPIPLGFEGNSENRDDLKEISRLNEKMKQHAYGRIEIPDEWTENYPTSRHKGKEKAPASSS
ncbi:hypothetical protein F5B22DRAFT_583894 [Xylaria bambusicola]|uniref:uncharacterized protein n=1 Tax=Xylaria bambusicola TaxID=326684 RepID=UPI002007E168|nr:uncharacterized protein F5B22DRAFT_583894 [Xylaria bambusicola]KAI0528162.1 hypothetical protein F5B22DRAFT_583894 [Xylaria bambusicola]